MNLPIEFEKRMKNMLGGDYEAFKKAFQAEEEYAGVRIIKKNAEKILGNAERVEWCENGYYTNKSVISGKHPYHAAGAVYFQEPSAMLPVASLPVEKDDYILDLCAAPGGKSTQIAERLGERGLLVANEIIPKRAEILAENIERCGGKNVIVTNEKPENLAKRFPEFFDKIVVDAPCSGEGMFRKEPQAIREWSVEHTLSCAVRQRHILDCALGMLKPGGSLIYSTCTFSLDENEKNVDYILANYPNITLEPIKALGAADGFDKLGYTKRIFPHLAKGEGHFAALFKKSGDCALIRQEKDNEPPDIFRIFEKESFNTVHKGVFHTFGERLYLLPTEISFDKLRVLRPGLYLGDLKKGRFEPSYALAHAHCADDFKKKINLDTDDEAVKKYLHGDVLECGLNGWVCVLADGYPLGWGKASGGTLKNHYPKKFRM